MQNKYGINISRVYSQNSYIYIIIHEQFEIRFPANLIRTAQTGTINSNYKILPTAINHYLHIHRECMVLFIKYIL